jgi:hypothetical protein
MPRRTQLKLDRKIEEAVRQYRANSYRWLEIDLNRMWCEAQASGVYPMDARLFQQLLVGEPAEPGRR